MLIYNKSVQGPASDVLSLPAKNVKNCSLTVPSQTPVTLAQEMICMVMHVDNGCLPLLFHLVPACKRVKYSSQELSVLLCEPAEQMRSRVYVSEVCMCTHPHKGECTCRQKHLQPPVSCLFYLRGKNKYQLPSSHTLY